MITLHFSIYIHTFKQNGPRIDDTSILSAYLPEKKHAD